MMQGDAGLVVIYNMQSLKAACYWQRVIYYVNGRTATVDQECCWQSDISKEFLVVQDSTDVKSQKRDVKS